MNQPTQKQLEQWLKLYQKILRLQDWDITIRYVEAKEISKQGAIAEINYQTQSKSARIKIMEYDSYIKMGFLPEKFDVEHSIVHELEHLHTAFINALDKDNRFYDEEEVLIEMNAHAIVNLKRAAFSATKQLMGQNKKAKKNGK